MKKIANDEYISKQERRDKRKKNQKKMRVHAQSLKYRRHRAKA